jgi:hypothetical protein
MCTNVHTHAYAHATHVRTRAYAHVRACMMHLLFVAACVMYLLLVALVEELENWCI